MKRSWLVVVLLLSVGINIGIVTMIALSRAKAPQHWPERIEQTDGPPIGRLAMRLGLEGEQRERFVAQQRRFFESFQQVRMELEVTRQQLRGEVGARDPDPERIDELLRQSAELTAALDRLFIDNVMTTRQMLDRRQERLYFGFLDRLRRQGEERERRRAPQRGR